MGQLLVDETESDQLLQKIVEESQEPSENYEKDTNEKQHPKVLNFVKIPKECEVQPLTLLYTFYTLAKQNEDSMTEKQNTSRTVNISSEKLLLF